MAYNLVVNRAVKYTNKQAPLLYTSAPTFENVH